MQNTEAWAKPEQSDKADTSGRQNTPLWVMKSDAEEADHLGDAISVDMSNRIVNLKELDHALFDLLHTRSVKITGDVPLPEGFVVPVLSLPPLDFGPDYFEMSGKAFVSRRFRDALAQPAEVVQFWPVELVRASDEARAHDYQFMRILAWQPAMDWERSVYEKQETFNRRTGERFTALFGLWKFVPLAGLVPRTEVFRPAETRTMALVVDAVAERVMRAGCTGVAFPDPVTNLSLRGVKRFRTADGVLTVEP